MAPSVQALNPSMSRSYLGSSSNIMNIEKFVGGEIWILLSYNLQGLPLNDAARHHDPPGIG